VILAFPVLAQADVAVVGFGVSEWLSLPLADASELSQRVDAPDTAAPLVATTTATTRVASGRQQARQLNGSDPSARGPQLVQPSVIEPLAGVTVPPPYAVIPVNAGILK